MMADELKQVIYIASVGYSGSTLLDMMLGANDGITALGEVYLLADYSKGNAWCTCGETVSECGFWKQVDEQLKKSNGSGTHLADLYLSPEGVKQSLFRKLPTLADIGLVVGHKHLWNGICAINKNAKLFRQAARNSVLLYESACLVGGGDAVVDSSKYALPLKTRYMELGPKLKIIFLIRDGRAVAKSLVKRKDITFESASRRWSRFNWNLELIIRSIPTEQIFRLRYEDLCTDVSGVLDTLTTFLGRSTPLENRPIIKESYHDIGGNPMKDRRNETVVKFDEAWKQLITDEERMLFQRIAGQTNKKYGY